MTDRVKEKVTYKETYKKNVFLKHGKLPTLKHQAEGYYVFEARLMAAGSIELDGVKLAFQDIRVFLKENT